MGAWKPYIVAFLIQATYAGMVLLCKAAIECRKSLHQLSLAIFCKIFMLAFVGVTLSLNVYGIALVYTSANLGATTINCLPVTTFAFAVLLRIEKLKIRTAPGIAKVAGIVVCMAGIAVLAFYKGPHLKPFVHHGLEFGQGDQDHHRDHVSSGKRILGCFLLLISSMCWGLWLVLQSRILEIYPSKLAFTSLQCLSSTSQSFLIAVAFNRDVHHWKLAWNVTLLSILYCGILVTGVTYYLQAWVIAKKGPVFLAMTTPLNLIMTILGSMLLLGEVVNLGSVLGGILLVISLYSVLWGKSKEERMENQRCLRVQDEENAQM